MEKKDSEEKKEEMKDEADLRSKTFRDSRKYDHPRGCKWLRR